MPSFSKFLIAATFLFLLDIQTCIAEVLENQIKTAYVLNFVKFTEWPAEVGADGRLTLCVVGSKVLNGALTALHGRKAGSRELQVVQYSPENVFAERPNANSALGRCQVVFIGESEQHRFMPIINSLSDSPVLTISDIDDFAEHGGGIGLRYRENKILFEVNMASVQRSNLRLPGQLLNLAHFVFRK